VRELTVLGEQFVELALGLRFGHELTHVTSVPRFLFKLGPLALPAGLRCTRCPTETVRVCGRLALGSARAHRVCLALKFFFWCVVVHLGYLLLQVEGSHQFKFE